MSQKKNKQGNLLYADSPSYKVFQFFNALALIVLCISIIFPYLNILAKAFNDAHDSQLGGILLWPRKPTLANITLILMEPAFVRSIFVTLAILIVKTTLLLTVQFMFAYALTKKFPLKNGIIIYLMIPGYIATGPIAGYVLMSKLGLLNTFWIYILPGLFSFYNAIVIRSYMQANIPTSLSESAYLDGASEFQVFFRIMLPLSKPVLATIALWTMVAIWNDSSTTLIYVRNPKLHTVGYKMMEVLREAERIKALMKEAIERGEDISKIFEGMTITTESVRNAQIILTTFPIIVTYPFLQKYFVKGTVVGAIKG